MVVSGDRSLSCIGEAQRATDAPYEQTSRLRDCVKRFSVVTAFCLLTCGSQAQTSIDVPLHEGCGGVLNSNPYYVLSCKDVQGSMEGVIYATAECGVGDDRISAVFRLSNGAWEIAASEYDLRLPGVECIDVGASPEIAGLGGNVFTPLLSPPIIPVDRREVGHLTGIVIANQLHWQAGDVLPLALTNQWAAADAGWNQSNAWRWSAFSLPSLVESDATLIWSGTAAADPFAIRQGQTSPRKSGVFQMSGTPQGGTQLQPVLTSGQLTSLGNLAPDFPIVSHSLGRASEQGPVTTLALARHENQNSGMRVSLFAGTQPVTLSGHVISEGNALFDANQQNLGNWKKLHRVVGGGPGNTEWLVYGELQNGDVAVVHSQGTIWHTGQTLSDGSTIGRRVYAAAINAQGDTAIVLERSLNGIKSQGLVINDQVVTLLNASSSSPCSQGNLSIGEFATGGMLAISGRTTSGEVIVAAPSVAFRHDSPTRLSAIVRVSHVLGAVGPVCDSIDFNADGLFPDDNDLLDFLAVYAGGLCSNDPNCGDIDFNNDGLFPDEADLLTFIQVLAGGECQ